jgi:hypothetical protein
MCPIEEYIITIKVRIFRLPWCLDDVINCFNIFNECQTQGAEIRVEKIEKNKA